MDLEIFEQFVVFGFVWAYSLRAQYDRLGWPTAQNYIMGNEKTNSFNLFKVIIEADSPTSLLSTLSDCVNPLEVNDITTDLNDKNFLFHFKKNKFLMVKSNDNK